MRRSDRARDMAFSLALVDRCTHGIMAMSSNDCTPYCLPLSFVRIGHSLYFHCARQGRKIDLLKENPNVCVTFVGQDQPALEAPNNFTTYFQSVIITGVAREVLDQQEKIEALRALCHKVLPQYMSDGRFESAITQSLPVTSVWCISIEEVSGKEKAPK